MHVYALQFLVIQDVDRTATSEHRGTISDGDMEAVKESQRDLLPVLVRRHRRCGVFRHRDSVSFSDTR
jgi:hypothetical protein